MKSNGDDAVKISITQYVLSASDVGILHKTETQATIIKRNYRMQQLSMKLTSG